MGLPPVAREATFDIVAGVDAKTLLTAPLGHARRGVIKVPSVYFLLLKHNVLRPERSPLRGIYWRPLVGPRNIDARMIRAAPLIGDRLRSTIAEMSYQICDRCRIGIVWKISTDEEWRLKGIASAMIDRGRLDAAGYAWRTSEQLPGAVAFWQKIGERTGLGYQPGDECKHMRRVGLVNARDRIHEFAGGRE